MEENRESMENLADQPVDWSYPDGLRKAAQYCFPDLPAEEGEEKIAAMIEYMLVR